MWLATSAWACYLLIFQTCTAYVVENSVSGPLCVSGLINHDDEWAADENSSIRTLSRCLRP